MGIQGNYLYRPAYKAKGQTEYTLFDTGITLADQEIYSGYLHRTNTLLDHHIQYTKLAGRAGGQSLYGGIGIGEPLHLYSNPSHDGKIYLGANVYFDEANQHFSSMSIKNVCFDVRDYGATGDGVTDDSTAVLAAITAASDAGGGTVFFPIGAYRIVSQILIPTIPATVTQANIRLAGVTASTNGMMIGGSVAGSILDLEYSGSEGKIETLGTGLLEIDHLNLRDLTDGTTDFIHTTFTTVKIHHNRFIGKNSGFSASQDAIVCGGTTTNTATLGDSSAFQGYGSTIKDNVFDSIRRALYLRVYSNAMLFKDNVISAICGSNQTTAITAASNAAAAVLTVTGHGIPLGDTPSIVISGFTGNWAAVNGTRQVTVVDANTFSIPINSTAFGAISGSPVFLSGGAIEVDAGGLSTNYGFEASGNILEVAYYPVGFKFISLSKTGTLNNGFYDQNATTISEYWFSADSIGNTVINGGQGGTRIMAGPGRTSNLCLDAYQTETYFPQPITGEFTINQDVAYGTNLHLKSRASNLGGASLYFSSNWDVAGKSAFMSLDNNGNLIFRAASNTMYFDCPTSDIVFRIAGYATALTLTNAGIANFTGTIQVDGVQVVSNRVIDARISGTIGGTWDADAQGVLDAVRDILISHGLGAAA